MWVPAALANLFQISKETVDTLRSDLAISQAEVSSLKAQLATLNVNLDWLRVQYNNLQFERTALVEKAYGLKLPAPELARQQTVGSNISIADFNFEDLGDPAAKQLGYPTYGGEQ